MGSSNKSRKHYKKDSRFVTDLYTFTYDNDLDFVRKARIAKDEGRQCTDPRHAKIRYNLRYNRHKEIQVHKIHGHF